MTIMRMHRVFIRRVAFGLSILACIAATISSGSFGKEPVEFRGRVIDQDTRQGIPNATVAARYMGGPMGRGVSSCNRIEAATSDADGWFILPIDARAGKPHMEAHHPEYIYGRPLRLALQSERDIRKWQVFEMRPSADNETSQPVRAEPHVFASREQALAASREEVDVYLKRFAGTVDERRLELQRLSVQMHCEGGSQTTEGGLLLIDSIVREVKWRNLPTSLLERLTTTRELVQRQAPRAERSPTRSGARQ